MTSKMKLGKKPPHKHSHVHIHVYPKNDVRPHDTTSPTACWCCPIEDDDLHVVTHRAADKRALYEDTLFTKVFQ